ncbi:MarR family transcriptional regulator [Phenylobacterium sp.]|uniref:MarR family winged helix-turn-helix transcriptional regulator n=1 Tax=Phenylobacterium sp. TaxID=1871053 RepID=UPI00121322A9|nr:MarR family transcriptional regulator [Phenylobacterium sp.]THD59622.1 MAG: MarR family transcriptional regulator [Phenylobacterium sp.]
MRNAREIHSPDRLRLAIIFVHNARMGDWSDDIHAVLLQINGYMNRPDLDQAFLARAGVKLDRALFPLLTRIGLLHPISVVELASLVGRNHSTVSRQSAKLEALGLVQRQTAKGDQRVRLLEPSPNGWAMLGRFADARRRFTDKRLGDWTPEERATLLDLLRRFSTAIVDFEAAAAASPRSNVP